MMQRAGRRRASFHLCDVAWGGVTSSISGINNAKENSCFQKRITKKRKIKNTPTQLWPPLYMWLCCMIFCAADIIWVGKIGNWISNEISWGKILFWSPIRKWKVILKWIFRIRLWGCELCAPDIKSNGALWCNLTFQFYWARVSFLYLCLLIIQSTFHQNRVH